MAMAITFNCPQGHRLTCPDQQAGKPGRCPKCGTVFRVPLDQSSAAAPSASVGAMTASADHDSDDFDPSTFIDPREELIQDDDEDSSSREVSVEGHVEPGPADQGLIIFLCPNGHRLHGAAHLVGHPGQCPHCNAKFLIPSPDDVAEEDPTPHPLSNFAPSITVAATSGSTTASTQTPTPQRPAPQNPGPQLPAQQPTRVSPAGGSGVQRDGPPKPPARPESHPLAQIFLRLWPLKAQGTTIEVHLGEGKLFVPDEFSMQLSSPAHGLFMNKEANGSQTLTAVAWSSVTRIVVRGLRTVPKGWFPEKGQG